MQRPASRNSEGEGEENPLGGLEATVSCLWVLTPLSATVSLVLVAVGMATNQWLHTTEKMSNPHYNGTGEMEYLAKVTVSGLWMFCFTNLCGLIPVAYLRKRAAALQVDFNKLSDIEINRPSLKQ
nr:unnamed protein product [Callosobruchus analis]